MDHNEINPRRSSTKKPLKSNPSCCSSFEFTDKKCALIKEEESHANCNPLDDSNEFNPARTIVINQFKPQQPRSRPTMNLYYNNTILIFLLVSIIQLFNHNHLGVGVVGGSSAYYVEQYLNSPDICSPASAIPINKLATLAMEQIHLGNYPNYTTVIKLSRWQDKHTANMFLNFRCRFEVVAPNGYGVMVNVRELYFRRFSSGICQDYIKFKPEGRDISAPVCGEVKSIDKQPAPLTLTGKRYHYDPKGGLDVIVNTGDYNTQLQDNSRPIILELVLTAYSKKCPPTHPQYTTMQECSPQVCIPTSLFCDGYVNCGYEQNYAVDEQNCPELPTQNGLSRGMSILLFILSAVGSLLAVGVCGFAIWCCVDGWKRQRRAKSGTSSRNRRSNNGPSHHRGSEDSNSSNEAGALALGQTAVGTLRPPPSAPPNDHILTTDIDDAEITFIDEILNNPPNAPKLEDLPPSYKDLFPEGQSEDIFLSSSAAAVAGGQKA